MAGYGPFLLSLASLPSLLFFFFFFFFFLSFFLYISSSSFDATAAGVSSIQMRTIDDVGHSGASSPNVFEFLLTPRPSLLPFTYHNHNHNHYLSCTPKSCLTPSKSRQVVLTAVLSGVCCLFVWMIVTLSFPSLSPTTITTTTTTTTSPRHDPAR